MRYILIALASTLFTTGISFPALAEGGGDEFPGQRRGGGTHVVLEVEAMDDTVARPGDSARPNRGSRTNK